MNPLTLVKRIKEINSKEAALGISEGASWHAKYKDSPYVFVGGVPFDLTEGDLLAIFSQYGEIVDVNLVRDKATGKPKGFAFVAYEDQRSTNLAVDNLNGSAVLGRIIRVDHVSKYKKKEEEDEEMEQQKREERGVCRAFQRGDCTRGASCKFSHNEQRAANTGWGAKEDAPKWGHDKHEGPSQQQSGRTGARDIRSDEKGKRLSDDKQSERRNQDRRSEKYEKDRGLDRRQEGENVSTRHDSEPYSRDDWDRARRGERSSRLESREDHDRKEKSARPASEANKKEDGDKKGRKGRSERQEPDKKLREGRDRKEESARSESYRREDGSRKGRDGDNDRKEKSGRHESERNRKDDYDQTGSVKRSRYDEDLSSHHHREDDERRAPRR